MIKVERMFDAPIITQDMHESLGDNINGPTLIKVPEWVKNPLGNYYLYFAHHDGESIRLAYNDSLDEDWKIYEGGALSLENSYFETHVASPEIYINNEEKKIYMYYHGFTRSKGEHMSRVAVSEDGISFTALPEIIGGAYCRIFKQDGYFYSVTMANGIYRSKNGLTDWENIPFDYNGQDVRHLAFLRHGGKNMLFYTVKEQAPERIYVSCFNTQGEWTSWSIGEGQEVLRPVKDYEGASEPLTPSKVGAAYGMANQLRDPFVYEEDGQLYLLYACAGESSIAMARLYLC